MKTLAARSRLTLSPLRASRPAATKASAVATKPGLSFAVVTDLPALDALQREWTALFEACGQPHQVFQTFAWLRTWAILYVGRRQRLCILTGRRDGRLVIVWPLVLSVRPGLRILTAMGTPLSQYCDALIADDVTSAEQDALLAYLLRMNVDAVAFRRVRDDAVVAPLLRRRLGSATNRDESPIVDFAGADSVEVFERRFDSKRRANRRRRRRRLEERGPVSFATHGPSQEATDLVAIAFAFKREWAARDGVVSPSLRDPRFEQFFLDMARSGDAACGLRVSALRCADEVAGIEISVACKGHVTGHVLAPNPALEKLSVGSLLAESTIVRAMQEGYGSVDLLAPADSYKLEWTATTVGVGDFLAARTLMGRAFTGLWLRHGRSAAKRLAHRLRPMLAKLPAPRN